MNSRRKPHRQSAAARLATDWCNRLLGVAKDRSFHGDMESQEYQANQTKRDYVWNVIGMGCWGLVFPLLTIVVTQLSGAELAGMFSMCFVVASLLMILANFGIRTFQVSDVEETYSFADYRVNRLITCAAALVAGWLYCAARGYDSEMSTICMSMVAYRSLDALCDVYEGRLQQADKMYLGGISLTVRSAASFVAFSLVLLVSRSVAAAGISMAVVAGLCTVAVTLPLGHLETDKSRKVSPSAVFRLFGQCWPLFAALFSYALIDNMPKFVMEAKLSYESQLYYNALYFPAMFILMTAQTAYRPMLVRMANVWRDKEKRRRFDLIICSVMLGVAGLTAATAAVMEWIGLDVMGFLYGIDFGGFREACAIMLIAGGVTAGIDFLYQVVTILRHQHDVVPAYAISLMLSLFAPELLVSYSGFEGAIIGYLIVMVVLFALMVWTYFRIRLHPEGREE